jgi:hypothetical protein
MSYANAVRISSKAYEKDLPPRELVIKDCNGVILAFAEHISSDSAGWETLIRRSK